jgi:energy-coupling factor transporter ATP-binding protein EcfA2
MKATELIAELQKLVAKHGDHPVIINHRFNEMVNYSDIGLVYHDNTLSELYIKESTRESVYPEQIILS